MTAADRNDRDDDALPGEGGTQRLDKWLWFARVIKTRTQAAGLVTQGKVRVNRDKIDKPSQAVRAGDVLTIAVGSRIRILEVLAPGVKRGSAAEAQVLFKDLTPALPPRETAVEHDPLRGPNAVRDPGSGRPTKRDRRKLDRLQEG
jgi:ribosome-associated heat shock protein Hsp15